jgi:hypothetical protein
VAWVGGRSVAIFPGELRLVSGVRPCRQSEALSRHGAGRHYPLDWLTRDRGDGVEVADRTCRDCGQPAPTRRPVGVWIVNRTGLREKGPNLWPGWSLELGTTDPWQVNRAAGGQ